MATRGAVRMRMLHFLCFPWKRKTGTRNEARKSIRSDCVALLLRDSDLGDSVLDGIQLAFNNGMQAAITWTGTSGAMIGASVDMGDHALSLAS